VPPPHIRDDEGRSRLLVCVRDAARTGDDGVARAALVLLWTSQHLDNLWRLEAHGQVPSDGLARTTQVQRVVGRPSVRRTQVTPLWQSLAAVLIVAVGIAGIGIVGSGFRLSVTPPAGASPTSAGPSPTPGASVATAAAVCDASTGRSASTQTSVGTAGRRHTAQAIRL
jgi:hypothetical protein